LLAATGDDVKVMQELRRHAKISATMEVYVHAGMEKKHAALRRAIDVLLAEADERYRRVGKTGKFRDCSLESSGVSGSCGLSC
jgi:hypothetical protein